VARVLAAGALLYLVLAAVGLLLTRIFGDSEIIGFDDRVNAWIVVRRTATLDALTDVGSSMADTGTAVAVTVVAGLALRAWLGRWRESLVVLASISGELFVFLLVTNTVDRKRPPVQQLDEAPPTSSFPSGHTAAAVALFGCLAVVLLRQLADRRIARVVAVLLWTVPVVVAVSRVYRGMHYPSDVFFGFLGGGTWMAVVVLALLPAPAVVRPATAVGAGG
jgi:undecaprenyl-diphosphatase